MPDMPQTFRPKGQASRRDNLRAYDRKRKNDKPWRRWYSTARWQRTRRHQLEREPLCMMCRQEGRRVVATVCDHVDRHNGDAHKFWSGPFQSLCEHHHNSAKQIQERSKSRD